MRKFITHIVLFCLPFITLFAFPFTVLFTTQEFISVSKLNAISTPSSTLLIGPAYSYFRNEFQLRETQERTPKILALGNSRVGEFRDVFFTQPKSFYNASGATGPLSDYRHFLESLSVPPKILIVNMDQAVFNGEQPSTTVTRPNPFPEMKSRIFDPFFESFFRQHAWWKVYRDYYNHKFTLTGIFSKPSVENTIGVRARTIQNGFLRDGSDYYGDVVSGKTSRESIDDGIAALASHTSETYSDTYGKEFSTDAFKELRALLSFCKENNIQVVGFTPPLAHAIYKKLSSYPNAPYSKSFNTLSSVLKAVYTEYGYEFYDFTDLESFQSSDAEMVEAKHGGEKMYARMTLQMSKDGVLTPYVARDTLTKHLQNATSTYILFGLSE